MATRIHSWLDTVDYASVGHEHHACSVVSRPDSPLLGIEDGSNFVSCLNTCSSEEHAKSAYSHDESTLDEVLESILSIDDEEEEQEACSVNEDDVSLVSGLREEYTSDDDQDVFLAPSSMGVPSLTTKKSKSDSWSSSYSPTSVMPHTPNSSISFAPVGIASHSRDSSINSAIFVPSHVPGGYPRKASVIQGGYPTRAISRQSSTNFSMPTSVYSPSLSRSTSCDSQLDTPPALPVSHTVRKVRNAGSLLSFPSMSFEDVPAVLEYAQPAIPEVSHSPISRTRSRASSSFRNAVYIESHTDVEGLERRLGDLETALQSGESDRSGPNGGEETEMQESIPLEPASRWSPASSSVSLKKTGDYMPRSDSLLPRAPRQSLAPSSSIPVHPPVPSFSASAPNTPAKSRRSGDNPKKMSRRRRLVSFITKMTAPNYYLEELNGHYPPTPTAASIRSGPQMLPAASSSIADPGLPSSREDASTVVVTVDTDQDIFDPFAAGPITVERKSRTQSCIGSDMYSQVLTVPSFDSVPLSAPPPSTPKKSRFSILHGFKSMHRTPTPASPSPFASSVLESSSSSDLPFPQALPEARTSTSSSSTNGTYHYGNRLQPTLVASPPSRAVKNGYRKGQND